MSKSALKLVLVIELILLAVMLLADFGIIRTSIDPLSTKGILTQVSVVILIIASFMGIKKSRD